MKKLGKLTNCFFNSLKILLFVCGCITVCSAPLGSNITLDCHIESYPLPLNYWTFGSQSESIYISGPKYDVAVKEKSYKRHLRLIIHKLDQTDLGLYRCHAQNALGRMEKQVRVYGKWVF